MYWLKKNAMYIQIVPFQSISWLLQPNSGLAKKRIHIPRFHVPCFWGYLKRRRCFHSIRASMQEKHALISQLEEFDVGKAECRMQEDKDGGTKS